MKTAETSFDPVSYESVINEPVIMTRKRLSDEVHYPPLAEEPAETMTMVSSGKLNKLPRFEYVTQISAGSSSSAHHLLNYCDAVDFHNEKGQRIYLTDSENAEFVNIMLQENLLSVQAPNGEAQGATTATTTELIELNSAELLDLDEEKAAKDEEGVVTFVNNSDNENDFEKQLVRVEIQDETPAQNNTIDGSGGDHRININICPPRREQKQQQQGNGNFRLTVIIA